jgi:hypothetical protein
MAMPPITVRTREREAVPREKTLMLLLAVNERGFDSGADPLPKPNRETVSAMLPFVNDP